MSGVFTGAFAIHPFTGAEIPIWIGDYVLSGYGTGAVMAVPAHDSRDYAFAKQFHLPILEVVSGGNISESSYDAKEGILIHSDFLNGLDVKSAVQKAISEVEKKGIGTRAVNYRLRDAAFGRQRYWGEPIPMYYKNGLPYPLPESALPLVLPEVDKFLPTEDGEPPLARAQKWFWDEVNQKLVSKDSPGSFPLETTTMPGWAGSSWYFLRYMDPNNSERFASKEAVDYWKQVDVYMGGAEHGTGHLLYVRFWTKVLFDLGLIPFDEPAKKLINQGMIQGVSSMFKSFAGITHPLGQDFKVDNWIFSNDFSDQELNEIVIEELVKKYPETNKSQWRDPVFNEERRVDISLLDKEGISPLDFDAFKTWVTNYFQFNQEPKFFTKDGTFRLRTVVEKMSKSKLNVVNPDEVCDLYGADTLRLYEMFLGPIEQHKPWSTQGIEGVYRFLRKLWRLHYDNLDQWVVSDAEPDKDELKILHKLLKKIEYDVLHFSFNTSVSAFMICVNELTDKKCTKRAILEPILIALAPFAPHFCEELWQHLGHTSSIHLQTYPAWDESYLTENEFTYPVSVNGKVRTNLVFGLDMLQQDIESQVLADPDISKWLEGKPPKKIIFVKGRIINLVV
jgi:leucyl-tRNA synthetase